MVMTVDFYTKQGCPLCDEGLSLLKDLAREMPIEIKEFDIYTDDGLLEKYQLMIPVVAVNGREVDFGKLSPMRLRQKLREAAGTL